jgi:uncharacterized repeat protein (TIGR01451 family)
MKRLFIPSALALAALVLMLMVTGVDSRAFTHGANGQAIINEWSQGNGGSKEWVEILVVTGPQDMRGWTLSDKTPTDLTFSADSLWSNVPAGTVIVVYNGSDRDTILPPDDTDLSDFVVIVAHNHPTLFAGGWGGLSNSDSADNPQLADNSAQIIHDYSIAPGATAATHPAASECTAYVAASAAGVTDIANWATDQPATTCTPGQPNGSDNTTWIDSLRDGSDAADLFVTKTGPTTIEAGDTILYHIEIGNSGSLEATDVILTDTLPADVLYSDDDSPWTVDQPAPNTLVWDIGNIAPDVTYSFTLTVTSDAAASGTLINQIEATTISAETTTVNNSDTATTTVTEPPSGLIINEIHADPDPTAGDANGDGSADTSEDEFVELVNATGNDLSLSGWTLTDTSALRHTFPDGTTLPDGCALLVFGGGTPVGIFGNAIVQTATSGKLSLNNTGDTITIADTDGMVVSEVAYGDFGDLNQSLTRDPDLNGAFVPHSTATDSGGSLFSPGTTVDGASFGTGCARPDLAVDKVGPSTSPAGVDIVYTLRVENLGSADAPAVTITDTLPSGLVYVSDTSGFTVSQPQPNTLVWEVGTISQGDDLVFQLMVAPDAAIRGTVVNNVVAATSAGEGNNANNSDSQATIVGDAILLNAVHYYAYETDDEAVQLINVGGEPVQLDGWRIENDNGAAVTLPAGTTVAPTETVWITKDHAAFERQFGFSAEFDLTELTGSWPSFSNNGEVVTLFDGSGQPVDVVVYGNGETGVTGWNGQALEAYRGSSFAIAGQILYRMLDQATGLPVMDTNSAESWAQSTNDIINGKKVRYPGWDLEQFFQTFTVNEVANVTIGLAPDNAFETVVAAIESAETSIQMEALIFTNLALMQALADAADRGVAVDVLLEGSPAGGLLDQERYLCQLLDTAGGQCWFIINETDQQIYDRYQFMHAKFILIDGERAVVSSENMTGSSMPYDDKSDGTFGRRGIVVVTDAIGVVSHLQAIFDADLDPLHHRDVLPWTPNHPLYDNKYGLPPVGFIPDDESGGITYTIRYPSAESFSGTFAFEVVQSPENSVRSADSLLGMVAKAGAGDTVLVQQLNERPYWGSPSTSNRIDDPNPRLEAYIDAARRGAKVRIMLDEYHLTQFYDPDDPADNRATCTFVNSLAHEEGLNLKCALSNATGLGIHNKMVLVSADGSGYTHIGSINGTEQSSKGNRELALQIQSNAIYDYLAAMFEADWPHRIYMPVVLNNYIGATDHVVISEVLYNPPGAVDDAEYIELANPTGQTIDISGYLLGDAVGRDDFEDVRRFPPGTLMPAGTTLVIAVRADMFSAEYNTQPDFEILDSDSNVPDLIDDLDWGDPATYLQLGNNGDEIILRRDGGTIVDAIAYGTGQIDGVVSCDLVTIAGRGLERIPYWRDTDDCSADFRLNVAPSPGILPE